MESVNIYPALATWKKDAQGNCPIHISIDINGKRAAFPSLKKKIHPDFWDSAAKCAKRSYPNASLLNTFIKQKISEYEASITTNQLKGTKITKAIVKKEVKGLKGDKLFSSFCTEQIKLKGYSKETRRTYDSEVTKMDKYRPNATFADIDYTWIQKYEQYMRETLTNHHNTIWKSLKFINTMLNLAIKVGGLIEVNPMNDYDRGAYKQGIPDYIEWSEAQKIHKEVKGTELTEHLKLVGYYALLSYYTGLRFSDALKFDYAKKVIKDTTGNRLVLYAQKNGEIVSIGFNKYITEVVDFIKDKPLITTNQEYNQDIRLVCAAAKVNNYADISSHSFRHGYAMRCAELGLSIDDVQKLLGHNKRSSTEIYFRVKSARLDEAMKKWE